MTLRSDVAELPAGAGILDVDVDDAVADEHVRSSAYRRVVSVTASSRNRDRDRAVAATILRDPHGMGSRTAVVALVDTIATKVTDPAEFRQWSAGLLPEIDQLEAEGHREFIRRRVHDWLFCLSVKDGHVPTPAELAKVTDWMQRVLAEKSTSQAVLALLAESGSSRKIRNIAQNRAGGRGGPLRHAGQGGMGRRLGGALNTASEWSWMAPVPRAESEAVRCRPWSLPLDGPGSAGCRLLTEEPDLAAAGSSVDDNTVIADGGGHPGNMGDTMTASRPAIVRTS